LDVAGHLLPALRSFRFPQEGYGFLDIRLQVLPRGFEESLGGVAVHGGWYPFLSRFARTTHQ
jgi:hypothetical protein